MSNKKCDSQTFKTADNKNNGLITKICGDPG